MTLMDFRPVITVEPGTLRGVRDERGVTAFRGIPYADAPVGALRLSPPQPHPGWSGVRDAAVAGPSAPQGPSRLAAVIGTREPDWDEAGCLTLNVWSPPRAAARGVLVWFHGGAFTSGCGGWDWYDGAWLAALGGIVVVTANYRLGPLGYLYLPEIGADNLGSQDQRAVLRWVRANIAAFGGDPGNLTVGGQSAGAYSALACALDPDTAAGVRRVIVQSGPWIEPLSPAAASHTADIYLRLLGIDRADAGDALRARPVTELLAGYGALAARTARATSSLPPLFPVHGGAAEPRSVSEAAPAGALAGTDVLVGSTSDEMTAFHTGNPATANLTRAEVLAVFTPQLGEAAEFEYDDYLARHPDAAPARVFSALATEHGMGRGVRELAHHCAAQGSSTYVYHFTRQPDPDPLRLGATHCSDLPFTFGTFDAFAGAAMLGRVTAADRELAWRYAGALAAFVATGSPNGPGLAEWPPFTTDSPTIKIFDNR